MKRSLFIVILGFSNLTAQAQTDPNMQLWASVPGFECRTSGCQADTGAKIAANLTTDMRNSKRIRVFENEAFADLRFVGIITDIKSSSTSIFGVNNLTVDITTTIQAVDFRTSEVIWSGRATGRSEVTNFIVSSAPTLDGALQESSKNAVKAILASEDLKPYFKRKPGETPVAQPVPSNPATTTPTIPPQPALPGVSSVPASSSASAALEVFVASLKALDFTALNNSLTAVFYNPLQLKAALEAVNADRRALASLATYSVTPAEALPNMPFSMWDVVYALPGAAQKVVRLTAFNDASGQLSGRPGWRVMYFPPNGQLRGLNVMGTSFAKSSEAVEGFLGEFHAAFGIPSPR
jgi:hypothetical protein